MNSHVEDMHAALGGKVEKDVLLKDLELYVNQYRVSLPSAKRSIVKKYGGDPDALSMGVEKNLAEISAGENGLDTSGRVVYASTREIDVEGQKRVLLSGLLEDATGSMPFTVWDYGKTEIRKGDIISVRNAYATSYRDRPQLNMSSRSKIVIKERIENWSREPKKMKDIGPNDADVTTVAKIISITPKKIVSNGRDMNIHYGLIGDETKTLRFTAWKDFGLSKGDVVKLSGAYSRERNGEIQLNFSERTAVEIATDVDLPSVARFGTPRKCTIMELRDGMGNVTVTGRIINVERKEIETQGRKSVMFSGTLADETGRIAFTGWRDFPHSEGQSVTISGAYVRSWKGIPQLKFDEKSEIAAEMKAVAIREEGSQSFDIGALAERGGAMDATVSGTIIEIRPGTGFIFRCPQCGRATRAGECRTHGRVEGVPDFRISMVVDDGTGSMTVGLHRELSEALTGMTLDDARKRAEETLSQDAVISDVAEKLLFARMNFNGNVFSDDFGLSMTCRNASRSTADVKEKASALYQEVIQSLGM